jgi:uncharacterized membrane protein YhaH (DUF805 family)
MRSGANYWFPAKRYGWGWGPPITWQGWLVMILWIIVIVVVSPILAPTNWLAFVAFMIVMVSLLIAICYAKGEPPRWRWGEK